MECAMHIYEVRPRKDKRGVDLVSDALAFGRLWYGELKGAQSNVIGYAQHFSVAHGVGDGDATAAGVAFAAGGWAGCVAAYHEANAPSMEMPATIQAERLDARWCRSVCS